MEFLHLDDNESAFFQRELQASKARSYDIRFPELKAKQFVPVDTSAGPGAETIRYEQFTKIGMAKLIANYGTDFPRSDVDGKEFFSPVKSIGSSYGWNVQEIRAAAMANRPLRTMKAEAARRSHEQKEDYIAAFGDAASGLLGFLNHPNVPATTVPVGVGGDEEWELKLATPTGAEEVLKDLNDAVIRIIDLTNGVERPDTILIPEKQYALIASQRLPDSDTTILEFFMRSQRNITALEPWYRLKGAGAGGTDRMVTYKRSSDKLTFEMPQPFESFDPQQKGMEFVVHNHSRTGGVIVYYPLSMDYADGI